MPYAEVVSHNRHPERWEDRDALEVGSSSEAEPCSCFPSCSGFSSLADWWVDIPCGIQQVQEHSVDTHEYSRLVKTNIA